MVARQAHNLEVSGSIPLSATIYAARILFIAKIAQLVEHDLAKVGVAGSSPVFRSPLGISNVFSALPRWRNR